MKETLIPSLILAPCRLFMIVSLKSIRSPKFTPDHEILYPLEISPSLYIFFIEYIYNYIGVKYSLDYRVSRVISARINLYIFL